MRAVTVLVIPAIPIPRMKRTASIIQMLPSMKQQDPDLSKFVCQHAYGVPHDGHGQRGEGDDQRHERLLSREVGLDEG